VGGVRERQRHDAPQEGALPPLQELHGAHAAYLYLCWKGGGGLEMME
jgi:hypothetical protein